MTKEFLDDVDATDAADLLVYTGNTEVGGAEGNFSAANVGATVVEHDVFRSPQNNSRVRGLAKADLTRDYLPTTIVFDGYNTSRVEVNRGPNATLFGLGSPGGIINNKTIQPSMEDATSIEFNVGSFGTTRSILDVDRELVPDKLGVRFAALYEDERFQQDVAFDRDRRFFLATRIRPFENANLRLSYEKGEIDANRPRPSSPRDVLTRWWNPAFNKVTHSPADFDFNTVDRDIVRAPGGWFAQPAMVFESNTATAPARMMIAWNNLNGRPRRPGGNPNQAFQANMVSITLGSQWYPTETAAAQGVEHGSFFIDNEIGDPSIFDWRNQLFDGPNKREWEDFDVINASYDQKRRRQGSEQRACVSWKSENGRSGWKQKI
ncbi:MAG: hypothetical protein ACREIA_15385 [Opitutaceae bacterium]